MAGFQLTYSTMFAAPPELHELFDRALVRVGQAQGREHALFIDGCDVFTDRKSIKRSPTGGITFTGSHAVGVRIAAAQTAKRRFLPVIAEMGGKNSAIVTRRADLDSAATGIVRSSFGLQGQKCSALSRLYVDEGVADALIEAVTSKMKVLTIGDPTGANTWFGPMATQAAYDRYADYCGGLRSGGSRILMGGEQLRADELEHGFCCAPILAKSPCDHPLWNQEMFCPIVMLRRVSDREHGMLLANRSEFGLTAGFYGAADEIDWFFENIEAGVTYANRSLGATTGAWPGYQAFAGWKGSSSTGKAIGSFYYLPQYMREQSQTHIE